MKITFTPDTKDSNCNRFTIDSKGVVLSARTNGPCHGQVPANVNNFSTSLYFKKNNVNVSKLHFKNWIKFCNSCGFKCTFDIVDVKLSYTYEKLDGSFYEVKLIHSDFVNDLHIFAAITVIRMISYRAPDGRFQNKSRQIIEAICELSKPKRGLAPLSALILASTLSSDSSHFIIGSDYSDQYSRISTEEMLNAFKHENSLNSLFSTMNNDSSLSIRTLLKQKQYDKIIW